MAFRCRVTAGQRAFRPGKVRIRPNVDGGLTDWLKLNSITAYRGWERPSASDGTFAARTRWQNDDPRFWSQELRPERGKSPKTDKNSTSGAFLFGRKDHVTTPCRGISATSPSVCRGRVRRHRRAAHRKPAPLFPLQFIGNDTGAHQGRRRGRHVIWNATDQLDVHRGIALPKESRATVLSLHLDARPFNGLWMGRRGVWARV